MCYYGVVAEEYLRGSVFLETQVKVKVKVMSIYIASIHETSLRRSGIARIVNGYHSFTCKPCVSSASRMSHTCLCLASRSWYYYFPTSAEIEPATSRLQVRHSTTQPLVQGSAGLRPHWPWRTGEIRGICIHI